MRKPFRSEHFFTLPSFAVSRNQIVMSIARVISDQKIPLLDFRRHHDPIRTEIDRAISSVIEASEFVGGRYVKQFEEEFAAYTGADFCVGVSSGTSALELALRALEIGKDDEVIIPANTFIATAEAVAFAGSTPVFVDVQPASFNIDPDRVAAAITARTKAIIAVHLYGQPADLRNIKAIADQHKLIVIEDACQAHGAKYFGQRIGGLTNLSAAACFSFYPGKNLGALGDAGAVTTNDERVARAIRLLRDHGSRTKYVHERLGYNHRLDGVQAAVLSVKLRHLDRYVESRRALASAYNEALHGSSIATPSELPGRSHAYHLYVVRVNRRDAVRDRLAAAGVSTGIHYPIPLHLQPVFRHMGYSHGAFPVAESCSEQVVSLPLFPEMTRDEIEIVADNLLTACEG